MCGVCVYDGRVEAIDRLEVRSGSDNSEVSDAENGKTCSWLPVASTQLEPRRVPSV